MGPEVILEWLSLPDGLQLWLAKYFQRLSTMFSTNDKVV